MFTRFSRRSTVPVLLVILIFSIGCSLLGESASPTPMVSDVQLQRIEFTTEEHGNQTNPWQQYIVNSDGSNVINLNSSLDLGTDNTVDLLWEPNGERVAFTRKIGERFRAYISNADGSDFVELGATLSGSNMVFEWSPNGESLIIGNTLSNDFDDILDIYVVKKDNSALTKIITNIYPASSPSWSPDGKHILIHGYTSTEEGVFIFNPDGTGGKNLMSGWDYFNNPTWSPNSKFIIFEPADENSEYLYMVDIDSVVQVELMSVDKNTAFSYEWSDNSQYIAVKTTIFTDPSTLAHYVELHLINIESMETTPILTGLDTSIIGDTYWIEKGNYVVFNAYINGNSDIYRVNTKTKVLENLTQSLSDETAPIPSPDGEQIAFVTDVAGDGQIHILNLDDNSTFKLTSNSSGTQTHYRWSSNSKYLAYSSKVDGIVQVFVINVREQERSPLQISHTEVNAYVQDWVP